MELSKEEKRFCAKLSAGAYPSCGMSEFKQYNLQEFLNKVL